MRRVACVSLFVGCLFVARAFAAPLVVVSIDGLHPDYVTRADAHGLSIPTLRKLMSSGSYAAGVVGVVPTVTYPSHTTMLTGVAPARHGIQSNTTFDPTGVNKEGWYWYAEDIKVPTLWAAAKRAGLRTASVNWPVTIADRNIDFLLPEYWRTSTPDDGKLLRALARPENLLIEYERTLGPFVDGYVGTIESDRTRTRFAVKLMQDERPDFIAVHLIALDEIEHHDGPMTPTAFATLEALDTMIGDIWQAALARDPRSVIAIVSDHGFQATHTAVNLRTKFVDAGLIKLKPQRAFAAPAIDSWDAQVWSGGAVAAIVLRDANDAATKRTVERLLETLRADARNGIARVVSRAELGALQGFPDAEWLVEFTPGFYLGGELRGDLLTPATSKGTHGYLPHRPEMHASLFVAGASIRRAQLGVIDMRQLAPTFANVLNVRFESEARALDVVETRGVAPSTSSP